MGVHGRAIALAFVLLGLCAPSGGQPADSPPAPIVLRAWGVQNVVGTGTETLARTKIVEAFQQKFPHIQPVATTGISLPGGRTMDFVPLMQIAGDIPGHVMYVNFRQSHTYISNKLLYPLDKYVERDTLGLDVPDGHLLPQEEYVERLKRSPHFAAEVDDRFPQKLWPVIRRECPYGADCPHLREWGAQPAAVHSHIWAWPQGPGCMGLIYRRDLFQEAGLPDRGPETWEEFLDFARRLTNPKEERYGLEMRLQGLAWPTLGFLYSAGGRLVDQDPNGQWRLVFDSNEAVEAYYFVARMLLEPFENQHGKFTSIVYPGETTGGIKPLIGMSFTWFDTRFFTEQDPAQYQIAPVPRGPTGQRASEFNSMMTGIYAGLEHDLPRRDAAWQYIRFYDGPEARKIRTRFYVENGLGRFMQPKELIRAGFPEYVSQVPAAWSEAYEQTLREGVPEPYGRNCQMVYHYANHAIEEIWKDKVVGEAIRASDQPRARQRIKEILSGHVARSNQKMLGLLTGEQKRFRSIVATIAAVGILIVFVLVFRRVFRTFRAASLVHADPRRRGWQFGRYKWAYLLLIPAAGSIALWAYYPLARGTLIAFEDYNVRGFSRWVGMENFANALFDDEFWYALWVSLKYATLFALFGFTAPIALAFLLTEVPRGKMLYRTIYYLPAVLSGVIVVFLWRGFYGPYGMINSLVNGAQDAVAAAANAFVWVWNGLSSLWGAGAVGPVQFAEVRKDWLGDPQLALLFVLLPVVWAGMGPGCLIYLAALKTVPEEIYEAADIDGAGAWQKVFHVSIPTIRSLILINFIGAMIGAVRGGSEFVLAMTGGGPYVRYGETEVIGLHIYWQAYGYLRFGAASAMAWVLGSLLVGFTVLRLQRLSRMEFRTAAGVA